MHWHIFFAHQISINFVQSEPTLISTYMNFSAAQLQSRSSECPNLARSSITLRWNGVSNGPSKNPQVLLTQWCRITSYSNNTRHISAEWERSGRKCKQSLQNMRDRGRNTYRDGMVLHVLASPLMSDIRRSIQCSESAHLISPSSELECATTEHQYRRDL